MAKKYFKIVNQKTPSIVSAFKLLAVSVGIVLFKARQQNN
jgi:hypothetical protein